MIQEKNHRQFLLDNGVAESNILQDEVVISREEEPGPGHVVTGPIYIENAEPGDILEVHVKDIEIRTPYGINVATTGALPNAFSESETNVIPIDLDNRTVQFTEDIDVDYLDKDITFPVDPFMGIMAVSQCPSEGRIDTIAPSYFGGNMDNKTLGIESTIYLPVSAEGALFWTGDGHAVQGNGEVCQTALETSGIG